MADFIEKGLSPVGSLRGDESKGDKTGSVFGEASAARDIWKLIGEAFCDKNVSRETFLSKEFGK